MSDRRLPEVVFQRPNFDACKASNMRLISAFRSLYISKNTKINKNARHKFSRNDSMYE